MGTSCIIKDITEEQLRSFIKSMEVMWKEVTRPLVVQNVYISEEDILLVDSVFEFMKTRAFFQVSDFQSQNLQVL